LQAEFRRVDQRIRVGIGLLHGIAVQLVTLLQRLAQKLFDQGTKFVTLAPEQVKS